MMTFGAALTATLDRRIQHIALALDRLYENVAGSPVHKAGATEAVSKASSSSEFAVYALPTRT